MENKNLILFDFDGTITNKDSLIEFIRFYRGNWNLYLGFLVLSPILLLYKFKLFKNSTAKQLVLRFFFKGEPLEKFSLNCRKFASNEIPKIVRFGALIAIETHLKKGNRVIVVTASAEDWIMDWCKKLNIELIATQLEKCGGQITGRIKGQNCYGEEKVIRIKQYLDIKQYSEIHAYGDSKGDKPMLELADVRFYKTF